MPGCFFLYPLAMARKTYFGQIEGSTVLLPIGLHGRATPPEEPSHPRLREDEAGDIARRVAPSSDRVKAGPCDSAWRRNHPSRALRSPVGRGCCSQPKVDGTFHGFGWDGTAVLHSENKDQNPEGLCESLPVSGKTKRGLHQSRTRFRYPRSTFCPVIL
jgi:hypothetical protein